MISRRCQVVAIFWCVVFQHAVSFFPGVMAQPHVEAPEGYFLDQPHHGDQPPAEPDRRRSASRHNCPRTCGNPLS